MGRKKENEWLGDVNVHGECLCARPAQSFPSPLVQMAMADYTGWIVVDMDEADDSMDIVQEAEIVVEDSHILPANHADVRKPLIVRFPKHLPLAPTVFGMPPPPPRPTPPP